MEAKKVTYYSLLEQHTNGAWWYHRNTFTSRKEAEEYFKIWLTGDFIQKRPRMILEHTDSIPDETMVTDDLRRFYNPYDRTELITILCHSQILKQTKC